MTTTLYSRVMKAAVVAAMALTLTSCGEQAEPSTAKTPPVPTPSAEFVSAPDASADSTPPDTTPLDKVDGLEASASRLPVGHWDGSEGIGFVDREVLVPAMGAQAPDVAPIFRSESGDEVIAMWGYMYGWIDLSAYNAPDFDLRELVAEKQALAAGGTKEG